MGREFRENIGWFRWINWSVFDCGNVFAYYYRNELDKLAPTLPTYSALHFDQSFLGYDRRFCQRLTNVQVLTVVQGPVAQSEIVELIGCFRSIVILWVKEGESLDRCFYNILPDHYPHLRVIHIDNSRLESSHRTSWTCTFCSG